MVTDAKYSYGEHSIITVNIPEVNITLYVSYSLFKEKRKTLHLTWSTLNTELLVPTQPPYFTNGDMGCRENERLNAHSVSGSGRDPGFKFNTLTSMAIPWGRMEKKKSRKTCQEPPLLSVDPFLSPPAPLSSPKRFRTLDRRADSLCATFGGQLFGFLVCP